MQDVDALLLGRRTYVTHAEAFEPMPAGDPFGDLMNAPKKYVVSRTLEKPIWRNTTIIRDNVVESVRALKAQPGQEHPDRRQQSARARAARRTTSSTSCTCCVYPLTVGSGKRVFPTGVHATFTLTVGDAVSERRRRPALRAQRS